MARGSPAGSLTKKPFVLNARSNIEAGAVTSSVGSRDRKVSRMQMGKWLHFFIITLVLFFQLFLCV